MAQGVTGAQSVAGTREMTYKMLFSACGVERAEEADGRGRDDDEADDALRQLKSAGGALDGVEDIVTPRDAKDALTAKKMRQRPRLYDALAESIAHRGVRAQRHQAWDIVTVSRRSSKTNARRHKTARYDKRLCRRGSLDGQVTVSEICPYLSQ